MRERRQAQGCSSTDGCMQRLGRASRDHLLPWPSQLPHSHSEKRKAEKGWHPPGTIWHLLTGFECNYEAVIHSILVTPILTEGFISRVSSSPQ